MFAVYLVLEMSNLFVQVPISLKYLDIAMVIHLHHVVHLLQLEYFDDLEMVLEQILVLVVVPVHLPYFEHDRSVRLVQVQLVFLLNHDQELEIIVDHVFDRTFYTDRLKYTVFGQIYYLYVLLFYLVSIQRLVLLVQTVHHQLFVSLLLLWHFQLDDLVFI